MMYFISLIESGCQVVELVPQLGSGMFPKGLAIRGSMPNLALGEAEELLRGRAEHVFR